MSKGVVAHRYNTVPTPGREMGKGDVCNYNLREKKENASQPRMQKIFKKEIGRAHV